MARVLFTISYTIPDESRTEYIQLVSRLRKRVKGQGADYNVYEARHKSGHFQEVYLYESVTDYEASDDWEDEVIDELTEKVHNLAVKGKIEYSTMIERI